MEGFQKPQLLFHGLGKKVIVPVGTENSNISILEEKTNIIAEICMDAKTEFGIAPQRSIGSLDNVLRKMPFHETGYDVRPTSYHAMHSYASMILRDVHFTTPRRTSFVIGVTITNDDQVVFGVRNHGYKEGLIAPVPGGGAKWPSFEDAFFAEMKEELGVTEEDMSEKSFIVGGFEQNQRIAIVFVTRLKLFMAEVEERWQHAQDKWEHTEIFGVPFHTHWWPVLESAMRHTMRECMPAGIGALAVASGYFRKNRECMESVFEIPK
ncbi:MAG: hypothetical protein G01um101470_869 [Parcubacteria group bacterium Gr01-1014_70]|nr:MAG: hypothetical protein G01um101470_869 [Parcubacteria group bacterium Gr01-1014_70]